VFASIDSSDRKNSKYLGLRAHERCRFLGDGAFEILEAYRT